MEVPHGEGLANPRPTVRGNVFAGARGDRCCPSQDRDRSIHRSRLSKTRCALQIHTHPELSFEELKTAAKLAAEMRALEFEVTEKVGKTELVAIYKLDILDNSPEDAAILRRWAAS